MNGRIAGILLWAGLLALLNTTLYAQERWVYLYDQGCSFDDANSVIMGYDGNLYAAGWSGGFAVLSVTDSGSERWVYRYEGAGHDEWANSVAMGSDGNLYAAGRSFGSGTSADFTVVSLTPSGAERWVYRCEGSCLWAWWEDAHSIVVGPDTNLYAVGAVCGEATDYDFTVVSLSPSGGERWVYRYDDPMSSEDIGYSIAIGPDDNLYAAGYSIGTNGSADLTVVSLTLSGDERWVYRYNGPTWAGWDVANTIAVGSDGNIYAAGKSEGSYGNIELAILSLTPAGEERWVYRYKGPGSQYDEAHSIIVGTDGNLYAVGVSGGFAVLSVTDSGTERWTYLYDGTGNDVGYSIVMGSDDNLYAAGYTRGTGASYDFTVVSLTASGAERWGYVYSCVQDNIDRPNSIILGSDGILYAAGHTWGGDSTFTDIIVLSLSPSVGVEEGLSRPSATAACLYQSKPNPSQHSTLISYFLSATSKVTLSIYDITGRLVETLVNETQQPGIHQVRWNRKENPSGVYFYRLKACPERSPEPGEGRSGEPVEPRSRRAGEYVEAGKMVVAE